jgi:hypothetical protein
MKNVKILRLNCFKYLQASGQLANADPHQCIKAPIPATHQAGLSISTSASSYQINSGSVFLMRNLPFTRL